MPVGQRAEVDEHLLRSAALRPPAEERQVALRRRPREVGPAAETLGGRHLLGGYARDHLRVQVHLQAGERSERLARVSRLRPELPSHS
eukprot:7212331-Prymnesium_polylepis.1